MESARTFFGLFKREVVAIVLHFEPIYSQLQFSARYLNVSKFHF
jgi:hypothetical protein